MRRWFLLAVLIAGCGGEDTRTNAWAGTPKGSAIEMIRVPPPPLSSSIFPCSRCHIGGAPTADTAPAMAHAKHIDRDVACVDCHDPDETGTPVAPKAEWCFDCHDDLAKDTAAVRAYFDATRKDDGTYAFPRRWKTQDVIVNHAAHATAGISCVACHGKTTNAPFAKPKSVPLMQRCLDCHTQPADGKEYRASVDCTTCHKTLHEPQHKNIVLKHAEDQRGCLDCHSRVDRDFLHLANGTPIAFTESHKLCGQCHGPKLRDWKIGLHGKRTGHWDGRKEYLLCVHCHTDPHAPSFPPMAPDPPPARPEDIR